ncbi:MAG: lysozyme inhibitor LprI family protein [Candidatus Acidiferrales bacterium]
MICSFKRLTPPCLFLGLWLSHGVGNCYAQSADPCFDKKTQGEMNDCEVKSYRKADGQLNEIFQKLLAKYAADKQFIEKLRLAEEAWVRFRDTVIESHYSAQDKLAVYGSVWPMCYALELTELTVERTKELKLMLSPFEGDVCGFYAQVPSASNLRSETKGGSHCPARDIRHIHSN